MRTSDVFLLYEPLFAHFCRCLRYIILTATERGLTSQLYLSYEFLSKIFTIQFYKKAQPFKLITKMFALV